MGMRLGEARPGLDGMGRAFLADGCQGFGVSTFKGDLIESFTASIILTSPSILRLSHLTTDY